MNIYGGSLMMLLLISTQLHATSILCWKNNEGIRECGSVIPPQYIAKKHEERDQKGQLIGEVNAEKSREELRQLNAIEERQLQAYELAEKKIAEEKALLDAYPTENDIEAARDSRLAAIKASVKVTRNQISFYRRSLNDAETSLKQGIKNTDDRTKLKQKISTLKIQIDNFNKTIESKRLEQLKIHEEFQRLLKKYRYIVENPTVLPSE